MPVGGDHRAAVGAPNASGIREATAGLLDHDLHGGEVPDAHPELDRQVDRSLGHEHVLPEVADASCHPRALRQLDEPIADTLGEEAPGARVADDRILDPGDPRDVDRLAVEVGPFAAGGPPAPVQRRRGNDADDELAVALEPDQRREHGNPAHEVLGAVDGVDDPADRAASDLAALLAEHRVARGEREVEVVHRSPETPYASAMAP